VSKLGMRSDGITRRRIKVTVHVRFKHRYTLKDAVFWDVMSCSLADIYRRFGRTQCLHLQDKRVIRVEEVSLRSAAVRISRLNR
jgi:hypothetical protein